MRGFVLFILLLGLVVALKDISISIGPQSKECLFLMKKEGEPTTVMYQITKGSLFHIRFEIYDNANIKLYETQKAEDAFTFSDKHEGEYRICFLNNEQIGSTKEIAIGFETTDEGHSKMAERDLKPLELQAVNLYKAVNDMIRDQHIMKMHDTRSRNVNTITKARAMTWAFLQTILFTFCSIFQAVSLKRFLEECRIL